MDELTQKLEVQGNEFQVPETYITQTENYLKQNDLAESQTLVVINNIRQAKSLIKNLDTDLSNVHSLDELIKRIPRDLSCRTSATYHRISRRVGVGCSKLE